MSYNCVTFWSQKNKTVHLNVIKVESRSHKKTWETGKNFKILQCKQFYFHTQNSLQKHGLRNLLKTNFIGYFKKNFRT